MVLESGVSVSSVCPALPLGSLVAPLGLGGQVRAGDGGPQARWSAVQGSCQGQCRGRCRHERRAERAILAGTAISCVRMVAVVALAWNAEASTPAARVRLNAIAASTVQAALAVNFPDGMCARPDSCHFSPTGRVAAL